MIWNLFLTTKEYSIDSKWWNHLYSFPVSVYQKTKGENYILLKVQDFISVHTSHPQVPLKKVFRDKKLDFQSQSQNATNQTKISGTKFNQKKSKNIQNSNPFLLHLFLLFTSAFFFFEKFGNFILNSSQHLHP